MRLGNDLKPLPPVNVRAVIFKLFKSLPAPLYWDFVRDFDAYVDDVTAAVTDAPPDQVLVAQGQARMCRALLRAFLDAPSFEERPTHTKPATPPAP